MMKHLKRIACGLLFAVVLCWPFLVWWNNVAMAEAAAGLWLKFLGVLLGLYLVGLLVEAWKSRKGRDGSR